jgi:hypothetical protein
MAVPSSGVLSLIAIINEVDDNDYTAGGQYSNISLKDLSDGTVDTINTANASDARPDGSAPHAMSEFYEYDHDLAGTSFSSVIADFTLTAAQSATVYSSAKTFTLTNPSGNLTAALTDQGGSSYGQLWVSISDSGDPGTSGTDNSATGFTLEGSTASITNVLGGASSGTIYVRYKFKGNSGAAATDTFNCTFTCNSVTDVVVITKSTTR